MTVQYGALIALSALVPVTGDAPAVATCRAGTEESHDFFVAWYTGSRSPDEFERMEEVVAPAFEMTEPEEDRLGRLQLARLGDASRTWLEAD